MRATEDNRTDFPENYFHRMIDVLKSAVIVGENAGGKSNFIKTLQYLKNFFKDNQSVEFNIEYLNDDYTKAEQNFCYGDTLQKFSLEVLIKNEIYAYDLEIDYLGIKYEKLGVQNTTIFIVERSEDGGLLKKSFAEKNSKGFTAFKLNFSVQLNQNYEQLKKFLQSKPEQDDSIGLYLSKIALLNVSEAVNFSNWINNTLCFESAPYSGYESSVDRLNNSEEMDRSLNPVLADKIISLVHGSEHQGQFIFTTHNVLHLNLSKQMKEQIYFVTKDLSTLHSELYSLADFSDIDYESEINLYEFYLRGVLGGIIRE